MAKKGPKKASVESLVEKLRVSPDTAERLLAQATEYCNAGKGVVLVNEGTVEQVAELFGDQDLWLNADLNDAVGWQFSQAIYALRQRGWLIKTLRVVGNVFASKWMGMGEPLKKRREVTA